jgi:hypothetical protein
MTIPDFASMTWTCNVCGDERPDAMIGVAKRPGPFLSERVRPFWNIRYCRDRPACVEYAQQDGEWLGPAERYDVRVYCDGITMEELNRCAAISQASPYDVQWSGICGRTVAMVSLHAASAVAAEKHVGDLLRAAGVRPLFTDVT